MSINLKAFHWEGNLLFNKVDITVPTLENNIYSRQMWNEASDRGMKGGGEEICKIKQKF